MKRILTKWLIPLFAICLLLAGSISIDAQAKNDGNTDQLNFLVVDSPYVESGDTQNIVASIGNGKNTITDAVLTYQNTTTGKTYQQNAKTIKGDAVLFSMAFQSAKQNGAYELSSISYKEGGKAKAIDLSGQNAGFGVNVEIEVEADAYITDLDTEVEANVVTVDGNGNQTSEVSIADAIEQAVEEHENSNIISRTFRRISGDLNNDGKFVVVLDPGHGGTDGGASRVINGVTYVERDLNLKIAQYCKAELEKTSGVTVYMTRTDNTSQLMDRKQRTDYAMSVGADVIVSLHINSTGDETTSASGSLVYCPNTDTTSGRISQELASEILRKLELLGLTNRGNVVDEELGMILYPKQYGVPGILVEHCFINNTSDAMNHLSTEEQLRAMGVADAHGILAYFEMDETAKYEAIFDAEYYAGRYADLASAFGKNKMALLNHFLNNGMREGRQGCESFDVFSYKRQYADLRIAYGNDLKSYYMHYLKYGKNEGRQGTGCTTLQNPVTVYQGVNYAAVYNYQYYVDNYADLKHAFGEDDVAALSHFVYWGMKEGRQGIGSFDVRSYKNQYADLRIAFGSNLKSYYTHYMNNGKREGRAGTGCTTLLNPITTYQGVNYGDIYDYSYYLRNHPEVQSSIGNDDVAVLEYFIKTGMSQGHQAKETFDVRSYKNQYVDLRNAFGSDLKSYYMHYMYHGRKEGRAGTGCTSVMNPTTVYRGVDYRDIYDYNYYLNNYPEVQSSVGNDDVAVLEYFINTGMSQGHQAKETFDVRSYKNQYADLRNAFGSDLKSYYMHYMYHGRKEGRAGTGCTSVQNPTTVYRGVNYGDVYDYNYYLNNYPEIQNSVGDDDVAVLEYFVNTGMSRGHQAKETFDVQSYKNANADLRSAYGSNLKSYYMHYINYGKAEGRVATGCSMVSGAITVYNGIDYSAVYNYQYYVTTYGDVMQAYGNDDVAVLRHFINYGMAEGRQGCEDFNVLVYRNNYGDLQSIYGDSLSEYYMHYLYYGRAEGRTGK